MCNIDHIIRKHVRILSGIKVSGPQLVRIAAIFVFITTVTAFSMVHAVEIEYGSGSNYHSLGMSKSAEPSRCANACLNTLRCKAWTFVKIGFQTPHKIHTYIWFLFFL